MIRKHCILSIVILNAFHVALPDQNSRTAASVNIGSRLETLIDDYLIDPQTAIDNLLACAGAVPDECEHQILRRRFGLKFENSPVRTLREIAADLWLPKERVRPLQFKALEKICGNCWLLS